jgi:hypothetical protein
MNRISTQAAKLWQLITSPDTANSYKTALLLTWDILKETALLIWLVICLVLVAFEWIWKTAFSSGQSFRSWVNSLEGTGDRAASEASRALLTASKNSLQSTLTQAKIQLGIPVEITPEPEPVAVAPKPSPTASSVVSPSAAPKTPTPTPAPAPTIERSTANTNDEA